MKKVPIILLLTWAAALAQQKGWHLPSDAEWQELVDFAGGGETAGEILKASSGWSDYEGKSGNGVDAMGFSALPGGRGGSNGSFDHVGIAGYWWSATENNASDPWFRNMSRNHAGVGRGNLDKADLCSVRCVQD